MYYTVKYVHTFYVCAFCDTRAFSLQSYCDFNTKSYCSGVCGYHRRPQTLAEICRNMEIFCYLRAVAARGKYLGFVSLLAQQWYLWEYNRKIIEGRGALVYDIQFVLPLFYYFVIPKYHCPHSEDTGNIYNKLCKTNKKPTHGPLYIYGLTSMQAWISNHMLSNSWDVSTHWGSVAHICVSKLSHHWFR